MQPASTDTGWAAARRPVPSRSPGQHRQRASRRTIRILGDRDAELVAAARRIVAGTRHAGARLSQIALAEKLRSEGYKVANNRLRWLAAVSGLEAGQDGEPETRASGGR